MFKKWSEIRRARRSAAELAEYEERIRAELLEMTLTELRGGLGITEEQIADASAVSQSPLSDLDRREDHLISTLRRTVRALGGELELTAVVGDKRVKLSL
jgi:hypothetical protein